MTDVNDQQDAGRAWIRKRLEHFASVSGVKIDDVEFANDARTFGVILIVRANGGRATSYVTLATLEDLANDAGEQSQMDARLRDLLTRSAASGHK